MSLYASIIAEDGDKKAKSLPGDVDKESKPATFIPRAIVAPRSLIPGRKIPGTDSLSCFWFVLSVKLRLRAHSPHAPHLSTGNAPGSLPIPDFSTKSRSVSNSNPLLNASPRMSSFSPSNTSPTLAPAQNSLSNRDTKTPSSVSGYDLVNDSTSLHIEQPRERYDPRKPNDVDVILAQRERVAREKERAKERELELERMRERAAADREQQERAWEMRERERTQQAHRDASRATAAADQATSSITDASGGAAAVSPAPAQPKVPYINSARMAALGLQRLAQPAPSPSLVASGAAATVGSNSTTGGVSQSVADQVDAGECDSMITLEFST